eukprot:7319264-Karenia_brevis.AAC.1
MESEPDESGTNFDEWWTKMYTIRRLPGWRTSLTAAGYKGDTAGIHNKTQLWDAIDSILTPQ